MYRRILIAYDGSDASRKAFDAASGLALRHGAELWVLSVAQPPEIGDDVETEAVIENSRRYHRRMLAGLKTALAGKNLKAHFEVVVGHPAERIIAEADKIDADLIVVGDRGRSRFSRLLLGSTSKHVTEHAARAVMVVR
jgi:nucleotide-binding universal stress UspA family protein